MSGEYLQLRLKSPLTVEPGFNKNPKNIPTRTLQIATEDGSVRKVNVPMNTMDNGEYILYAIAEFDEVSEDYQFDGADKFKYFRSSLSSEGKQSWDGIVDGVAHTNNDFSTSRRALLRTYFPRNSFYHFTEYLRAYKKTSSLTARALCVRLKTLFLYAGQLPGYQDIPVAERKKIFIRMFPEEQQSEFDRVHPDIADLEMVDIAEFFATYDRVSGSKRRNTTASDHTDGSSGDRGGGGSNGNGGNGNNHRRKKKRFGRQQNNNTTTTNNNNNSNSSEQQQFLGRPQNDEPCRVHAHLGNRNHKWSQCRLNPDSPNYRPRIPNSGRGQNNNQQQGYYTSVPHTTGSYFHAPTTPNLGQSSPNGPPMVYYHQPGHHPRGNGVPPGPPPQSN